jgi:hypothetical protein
VIVADGVADPVRLEQNLRVGDPARRLEPIRRELDQQADGIAQAQSHVS